MGGEGSSMLARFSGEMADLVEGASGSVVSVHGGRRHSSSGVVYAPGMVVTSAHAIGGDEGIEGVSVSTGDGRSLEASFVGSGHASGVAVLRVEGLDAPAAVPVSGETRVGEISIAVGRSARSGGIKASLGVVGGVGSFGPPFFGGAFGGSFGKRRGPKGGRGMFMEAAAKVQEKKRRGRWGGLPPREVVQTDAKLSPGMSGGALLDASGAVIGILAAAPMRGATFAVPASVAWETAIRVESRGGSAKRGFLGVLSHTVELPSASRESAGQSLGLLVVGVEDDSPADNGGVIVGDIIVRLDEKPVEGVEDLLDLLNYGTAGSEAKLEVLRGGTMTTLAVEIAERS